MANISLTTLCNRVCASCFGTGTVTRDPAATMHMSSGDFDRVLDFLERSGIRQARLLGGEPTLHPDFGGLARRVLARGLDLVVFSNGLMPESALALLESLPHPRIAVLVNVRSPVEAAPGETAQVEKTLCRLGPRAYIGFTIVRAGLSPDFLLPLITRAGTRRQIRLGLAHTTVTGSNVSLHPRLYPAAGRMLAEFAEKAWSQEIGLEFDCGFVPCMFPEGFLQSAGPACRLPAPECSPILDILPRGAVAACYPLLEARLEPLPISQGAAWLRSRFEEFLGRFRSIGIYRRCSACDFRRRAECSGGCLAASMQRLRPATLHLQGEPVDERRIGIPVPSRF